MSKRKYLAEFVGTAILVIAGCGSVVVAGYGANGAVGAIAISLAFGFIVVGLVYALGPISGCHINPAITLSVWAARGISAREVPGYIWLLPLADYWRAYGRSNRPPIRSREAAANKAGNCHRPFAFRGSGELRAASQVWGALRFWRIRRVARSTRECRKSETAATRSGKRLPDRPPYNPTGFL